MPAHVHPDVTNEASPVAERACLDCGLVLTGRYCAACGQEDQPLDPSLGMVLRDAWQALTNLEGRAFQSMSRLFSRPGFLTREYLEGRRARWVSPIRLYLVVSVVYFGLVSLTGWSAIDFEFNVGADTEVEVQRELAERGFQNEAELDAAARGAVGVWLPRAVFLLLPLFAALVGVARRDARRTYPQHMVFSLHMHAAVFGVATLVALVTGPTEGTGLDSIVEAVALLYALIYLVMALRTVYGGSLTRNVVLGLVLGVTYGILTIAVTIAILVPTVLAAGS
ncbi:MAG: DUF3667 domain-containing protein [Longimicrobiales bacterium]